MRNRRLNLLEIIISIIILYLFTTFFFLPLLEVIRTAFTADGAISLKNFQDVFSSRFGPQSFRNTLILGLTTVVVTGTVGTLLAFFTDYFRILSPSLEKVVKGLLLIPFMIPGVIIVLSVLQLFGSMGIFPQLLKHLLGLKRAALYLKGLPGILFIHAITQYIYFYVNVGIALRNLDHQRVDAARNLGAGRLQVLRDVILPHLRPALVSSSLLSFFSGISSFSAPYLLEGNYRVLTTELMLNKMNNRMGPASAQVIIIILFSLIAVSLYRFYERSGSDREKGSQTRGRRIEPKGLQAIISGIILITMVILIILPVIAVIYMSFIRTSSWMMDIFPRRFTLENYRNAMTSERMLRPLVVSFRLSLLAALITTVIGITGAMMDVFGGGRAGKITGTLFLLPMMLPASTLGVVLITAFDEANPLIGGRVLLGTSGLLLIAYIILSTTVVFNTLRNEFLSFPLETYEAARLLGAGRLKALTSVFLPSVAPGIFYAFSLSFLRSMGEYTASAFLYTVVSRPVSVAMVSALQDYDIGISMVYGSVLIITSVLFLLLLSGRGVRGTSV